MFLNEGLHELFCLIQFHIVQKHEIYTLTKLHHSYEEINAEGEIKSMLCSTDLKNKLGGERFDDKLKFMKSSQSSTSNTTKFVMPADESVLPNCLSIVFLGRGIQKSLLVKNCGKVACAEIQDRPSKEKCQWPPTLQDILEQKNINTGNDQSYCLNC